MKLLIVLSRFPYPLEKGDKLRAFHQIKELSKRHEICLVALSETDIPAEFEQSVKIHCAQMHIFKLKKPLLWWNTIKQFFTDKPYQVGYFYQNAIQRKIDKVISQFEPDHIYCQLIRPAEYVKNWHSIPKTLDYMDALGKGMFRRAEISSGFRKQLFLAEGKRLTAYENRIFDYFKHHTIISEQDKKFIQHPDAATIEIIENGIGPEFTEYHPSESITYDLVFIGNLSYAPNVDCAIYLAEKLVPGLLKTRPHLRVLIAGANPTSRIQNLQNQHITVSGWIEDIRTAYCSARVFVAPLFIGTGLQNKLLEAMALELPVVTTSLANNALEAVANESILIANNEVEFIEHINRLLDDEPYRNKLRTAGKSYIENQFSWKKSVEKLDRLFQS